jgi:hypothetical protein
MRAEALQSMRDNFEFLETMMSDERKWILESDGPSLADINGVFFPVKAAWTCVGSIQTNS